VKVLVVGSGAREHALALALSRDPQVTELHAGPGNPGIGALAALHPVDPLDGVQVASLAIDLGVDLVVIGPEAPLVAGVADAVRDVGIACFGPTAAAAQLEGSKAFAKDVMAAAGVPTARAYVCTTPAEAEQALDAFGPPYVVKDDGLAAGKGVVVTADRAVALAHAKGCARVVIEEYLDGLEVSVFAVTDGVTVVPLQPAQDFKRLGDGDSGPNTGGMGAYSPLPWAPAGLVDQVVEHVAQPTIDEMRHRGTPFAGLLYIGLALTSHGTRVVEFNARFGDPETQVVLPRLQSPLGALLMGAATGSLDAVPPLRWSDDAAVTVVVASPGYPDAPITGGVITGLGVDDAGSMVLQAGTSAADGDLIADGGRVLSVVGLGHTLAEARHAAYERLRAIHLDGGQYRTDIAASVDGT
jgi:phosphoribosylamine---glycine ligase